MTVQKRAHQPAATLTTRGADRRFWWCRPAGRAAGSGRNGRSRSFRARAAWPCYWGGCRRARCRSAQAHSDMVAGRVAHQTGRCGDAVDGHIGVVVQPCAVDFGVGSSSPGHRANWARMRLSCHCRCRPAASYAGWRRCRPQSSIHAEIRCPTALLLAAINVACARRFSASARIAHGGVAETAACRLFAAGRLSHFHLSNMPKHRMCSGQRLTDGNLPCHRHKHSTKKPRPRGMGGGVLPCRLAGIRRPCAAERSELMPSHDLLGPFLGGEQAVVAIAAAALLGGGGHVIPRGLVRDELQRFLQGLGHFLGGVGAPVSRWQLRGSRTASSRCSWDTFCAAARRWCTDGSRWGWPAESGWVRRAS